MAIYGGGGDMGGGGVDSVEVTAMAPGQLSFYDVGGPNFGTDLSQGIGSFDPGKYIESYMNSPFANQVRPSQRKGDKNKTNESQFPSAPAGGAPAETGRFGGTFGPKLKKFFKKVAEIHPATAGPMFAFNVMKGLKNSDDPKAFMQGLMKNLAMRKVMGNFGMSSMQRSGLGSLIGVAQGKQNMAQGLGSFATNAAFSQMMPNILKQAHQAGGMNGVYAAMAALQMARQRAQRGVRSGLAGPGGGG